MRLFFVIKTQSEAGIRPAKIIREKQEQNAHREKRTMRKTLTLCVAALAMATTAIGQKPRVDRGDFLREETGRKEAKASLKAGDRLYGKGEKYYEQAARAYAPAYAYNPKDKALNYKIGKCLLMGDNRAAALEPLLASGPEVAADYYLLLGRAYQYSRDYHHAVAAYGKYVEQQTGRRSRARAQKRVAQPIGECEFSAEAMRDSAAIMVESLGAGINSDYDDYAPALSADGRHMFFTSRRPDKKPRKTASRYDGKEQAYETTNPAYGPVADVTEIGRIASIRNIGVAGYSKTEERLFYYKGKAENGRLRTIALSADGKRWGHGRRVKRRVNKLASHEGALSLDAQNNMYFISDRRGGEGGNDIWYAEHRGGRSWGHPVNLGPAVNTPGNETSVYVTAGGDTLYFASDSRAGFGGYDIYMSVRTADGKWGEAVNMGYPINTAYDELSYLPTANPDVFYVSSSRPGTMGGLDIFSMTVDRRMPFYVTIKATDKESGELISADYSIIGAQENKIVAGGITTTDSTATAHYFEDHGNYKAVCSAAGYYPAEQVVVAPDAKGDTAHMAFALKKIRNPFNLNGTTTDSKTGRPVAATIELRSPDGALIGQTTSSGVTGRYFFHFDDRADVMIEATAPGYNAATASVTGAKIMTKNVIRDIVMTESRTSYTLMGVVTEEGTGKPVAAQIRVTPAGATEAETTVDADSLTGRYTVSLDTKGPYWVDIEARGYFFANDALSFGAQRSAVRNYTLKEMKAGVKITLENILFQTGSSKLKKSSFEPLDKFAELLTKNPDVRIEVSGHTDNVGKADANKRLSRARAKSVRDYLIKRGVEAERIDYAGYGMEQPVESNKTKAGREKNRRVEVKVLE